MINESLKGSMVKNLREKSCSKMIAVEPSENDVLCGRGNLYCSNKGNQRFQNIIRYNLKEYSNAKSRKEKVNVVDDVLKQIGILGSRIIKIDDDTKQWYELNHVEAHQKTGHCLRDQLRFHKNKVNKTKTKNLLMNKLFHEAPQARTVRRHQNYDNTLQSNVDIEGNDYLVDYLCGDSKIDQNIERQLSLMLDWNSRDFQNENEFPNNEAETAAKEEVRYPRRRSSSMILFDDEFPGSSLDFKPSTFFNQ